MKIKFYKNYLLYIFTALFLYSCDSSSTSSYNVDNGDNNMGGGSDNTELPGGFSKFISEYTDVYISGNYVIVESAGVPNHPSPYWGAGHPNYVSPHSTMVVNPNLISEQNFKFYIPLNPSVSSAVSSTPLGPIGVSISGVPFYNQYAGPNNQPLDNEIPSFDNYYGHPQQTGQYHYHWEPTYLTFNESSSMLIGYSLDGFPIYGPTEQSNGQYPSNLDELNGHSHSTNEYEDGTYHYHATSTSPYLLGGFKGKYGSLNGGGYFTN
jgi:hypothetical protein